MKTKTTIKILEYYGTSPHDKPTELILESVEIDSPDPNDLGIIEISLGTETFEVDANELKKAIENCTNN